MSFRSASSGTLVNENNPFEDEEAKLPYSNNVSTVQEDNRVNWIITVRIVLAICLIYYHNHRLFDNYRHNMQISLDFDEDINLLIGVRTTQRAVLQAGLNLVSFKEKLYSCFDFI